MRNAAGTPCLFCLRRPPWLWCRSAAYYLLNDGNADILPFMRAFSAAACTASMRRCSPGYGGVLGSSVLAEQILWRATVAGVAAWRGRCRRGPCSEGVGIRAGLNRNSRRAALPGLFAWRPYARTLLSRRGLSTYIQTCTSFKPDPGRTDLDGGMRHTGGTLLARAAREEGPQHVPPAAPSSAALHHYISAIRLFFLLSTGCGTAWLVPVVCRRWRVLLCCSPWMSNGGTWNERCLYAFRWIPGEQTNRKWKDPAGRLRFVCSAHIPAYRILCCALVVLITTRLLFGCPSFRA